MILTEKGVLKLMQRIKSFITSQLNTKAPSVHTHSISEIENLSSQLGGYTKSEVDALLTGKADTSHTHTKSQITDFPSYGTTANTICEGNDSRLSDARTPTSHTHVKSEITDFPTLATVATSGSYNDLSNKPTIPTVNDATLTIQQNSVTVDTFTANSSTDKTVNISVPTKTSDLNNDSGFITGVAWDDVSNKPTFATVATSGSYDDLSDKPTIPTVNNATLTIQKNGTTIDTFTANSSSDKTVNISVPTNTNELTNGAGYITADYAIPRSGGAVMTGTVITKTTNDSALTLSGGTAWNDGAAITLSGKDRVDNNSTFRIRLTKGDQNKTMYLYLDGTWTWTGTACQIISDQRLKQQITQIDTKLLDAWEDVNLVQFKYNDAVDTKKDKARLHTGFVVQQIDSACKKHGVDISQYGLYCHEVYPEETEEVEIEQADGTKVKEKKVIREASEHYSLRYTEALIVECMYLRREVSKLKQQNESFEQRLKMLEQSVK